MEEIPILPNNPETKHELPPDPKIIGDLLLGYKIRGAEPGVNRAPIAIGPESKSLVSRDKLRAKISRYKEQQAALSNTNPEALPPPELTETNLERRHEVFDEQGSTDDGATQTETAPALFADQPTVQSNSQPYTPPTAPPPLMPAVPTAVQQPEPAKSPSGYKKPLIVGLIAGAVTAGIFIYIYFR